MKILEFHTSLSLGFTALRACLTVSSGGPSVRQPVRLSLCVSVSASVSVLASLSLTLSACVALVSVRLFLPSVFWNVGTSVDLCLGFWVSVSRLAGLRACLCVSSGDPSVRP